MASLSARTPFSQLKCVNIPPLPLSGNRHPFTKYSLATKRFKENATSEHPANIRVAMSSRILLLPMRFKYVGSDRVRLEPFTLSYSLVPPCSIYVVYYHTTILPVDNFFTLSQTLSSHSPMLHTYIRLLRTTGSYRTLL